MIQKVFLHSTKNDVPIKIKCVSLEGGEVLGMSVEQFYRKVMCFSKSAEQIQEAVKEKITKYLMSSARKLGSIQKYNQKNQEEDMEQDEIENVGLSSRSPSHERETQRVKSPEIK